MKKLLEISGISKNYGEVHALSAVDLSVGKNEFVCIIGPNGCGKSTLLKIIAGISEATSGSLKSVPLAAYLPQKSSLLPWQTLRQNLLFPQKLKAAPDKKAEDRADRLLKEFGLSEFSGYYPHALSGGMQQKAALLRTVMIKPKLMLLDEPFSALDAITRAQMQKWLLDLWQKDRPSVICVTHDIREAILLADTIYVMSGRPGKVIRVIKTDMKCPRDQARMHSERAKKLEKELSSLLETRV
ncbi:MAG TPA: ABC transporter ATP-binding protein [Candidatus Saccharimonadales bacterium]|nr:ABC transporter ATP-binding protein [Candidatus Saccharimonadales bacterium]